MAGSPTLGLVAAASAVVPALVIAFPLIVWPLTDGANLPVENDFVVAPPTSEPGIMNRLFFPSLFLWGLVAFLALPRERLRLLLQPVVLAVGLYLLWAGMTAAWSDEPGLVMRRGTQQVMIVLAVLLPTLAARKSGHVLYPLLAVCGLTVAINILPVLTTPPGPLGHQGIYPQKNFLGAVMGICVITGFAHVMTARGWLRVAAAGLIVLSLFILVLSRSKTSLALAVLAPALGLGLFLCARYLRITPMVLMPLFMLGCYGVYQLGAYSYLWDFQSFASAVFGDPTLTRRTDIWAFAVQMIAEKPVRGWGYETFWNYSFDAPSVRHGPGFVAQMPHAHNGYLDVLLQTGAIGFAILMLVILLALNAAHRLSLKAPGAALLVLPAIVFAIGFNFLESAWFSGFSMISALFVLSIALGARFGSAER